LQLKNKKAGLTGGFLVDSRASDGIRHRIWGRQDILPMSTATVHGNFFEHESGQASQTAN
jgi:hypothetical protein